MLTKRVLVSNKLRQESYAEHDDQFSAYLAG